MRSSSHYKHSLFDTPLNQNQNFSILNSIHATKSIEKTICAKLRTFTKHHYLQYSSSEIVKTLPGFFFLPSRLDETTGVRPSPAIDNIWKLSALFPLRVRLSTGHQRQLSLSTRLSYSVQSSASTKQSSFITNSFATECISELPLR